MRALARRRQKESATRGLPRLSRARSLSGPMSLVPLNAAQLQAAHVWLATLSKTTRQRGESLFRERCVFDLESYKRGVGLRAAVQGTYRYTSKLRYSAEEGWSGVCTCPVGSDCKHCCATMLAALSELGADAGPTPGGEGKSAIAEIRAALVSQRIGTADPELAAVPASPKTNETFAAQIAARLGRPLAEGEKRSAREVDELFRHYRTAMVVPKSSIDVIAGTPRNLKYTWETVQLWPAAPQTPWEAWLYVAAYLRRHGLKGSPTLLAATDRAEIDALVGEWERHEEVEQWREWLGQTAQIATAPAPQRSELRVRLTEHGAQLESRKDAEPEFKAVSASRYQQFAGESLAGRSAFDEVSLAVWHAFYTGYGSLPFSGYTEPDCTRILNTLLRRDETLARIVGPDAQPLVRREEPLVWRVEPVESARVDYRLALVLPDGSAPPPPIALLDGAPSIYIAAGAIFTGPPLGGLALGAQPLTVPAEALETAEGIALLDRIAAEPPARIATRVRTVRPRPILRCALEKNQWDSIEHLNVEALAETAPGVIAETYRNTGWQPTQAEPEPAAGTILRHDRSALAPVPELLAALKLQWWPHENHWHKAVGKKFAEQFSEWLAALPAGLTILLDPMLASLGDAPVRATVKLEAEEAGIDWFDLKIALDVADTTFTKAELKLLLDARGGFVRLGEKGWRRIAFELSAEDEAQLADLGLSARDFSSAPQRLHALQLAGKSAARRMLGAERAAHIERRAVEIQTRVSPPVPPELLAELRPYQLAGFHFLAYLTANNFGGILADDMGLGKTVQALAWLLWLRGENSPHPSLVVCPKSVADNWLAEGAHFAPGLRVRALERGASDATALKAARAEADLVVANYAQLRNLEKEMTSMPWHAVILDEAQYIKNPESQTARAACTLKAAHRLTLSGTPIENRLLDLWSIMSFAMPGVLGRRADFAKNFDQRSDPLARRRLAARVRPFVLRRTKGEVAKDLPERIEEDLFCELDGEQATLYRAELKRARLALLNIQTNAQLDKSRFNVLTSLLRLRQICCHPALIGSKSKKPESAKLNALMDVIEPLMEEGHKVLVFSQFVEMLALIQTEIVKRDWRHFLLTGATEDRGPLVKDFQTSEGSAVFLISLRAGGFGLNLTAASYVVLFDPWWNPAVENQAIDRTHRIGQRQTVNAYRLLVKGTIEEKIRHLQKQKSALAADILGEESFARAQTLDDVRFLLSE